MMPGGRGIAVASFLLLTGAALTSAVSLVEVPVAGLMRRFALSRPAATAWTIAAAFGVGIPSALSDDVLHVVDALTTEILLPLASLGLLLYMGWALPAGGTLASAGLRSPRVGHAWLFAVRYIAPAALAALLASTAFH